MMSLLRRRMMMAAQEVEEMGEYVCNDYLYEKELPEGTEPQMIDTGISYGTLKEYERFGLYVYGEKNTGLTNAYAYFGNKFIGRWSACGFVFVMHKIGENLYEAFGCSGNPSVISSPAVGLVGRLGYTPNYYTCIGELTDYIDMSDVSMQDTIVIKIPETTQVIYRIQVIGITKKE